MEATTSQAVNAFHQTFHSKDIDSEKLKADVAKKKQLLSFVLKACDVGASSKPFQLHVVWPDASTWCNW